jgi:protease PrsW
MQAYVLAVASAAVWLWILRRYDRIEPEPLKTLLFVGFVGGLMSLVPAGILNELFEAVTKIKLIPGRMPTGEALILALFVGFNEESMKALATLLLVRRRKELNEPVDAMIYAMTVSLGFAAFENVLYMIEYGAGVILLRSLLSVPGHLVFAALWGFGLAKARFLTKDWDYLTAMTPYVVYAALAHAAYDFFAFMGQPLEFLIYALLAFMVWGIRKKLIYLEGQTPFLAAGECPTCRTINRPYVRFCKNCGSSLKQDFFRVCVSCEKKVPHTALFCPHCGGKLQSSETSA